MRYIYIVKSFSGEEKKRGTADQIQEEYGLTEADLRGISRGTEMGILVYREPVKKEEPVAKKNEKPSIVSQIRRSLQMHNNVALGNEKEKDVKEALRILAEDGIVLQASYNKINKGWLVERKKG